MGTFETVYRERLIEDLLRSDVVELPISDLDVSSSEDDEVLRSSAKPTMYEGPLIESPTRRISAQELMAYNPRKEFKISPDGERVAYFSTGKWGGVYVFRKGKSGYFRERVIRSLVDDFEWASDDRILYANTVSGYGSDLRCKVLGEKGSVGLRKEGDFQYDIIDGLINDPDFALIRARSRDEEVWSVYRLNLNTGFRTKIREKQEGSNRYLLDENGEIRLVVVEMGERLGSGSDEKLKCMPDWWYTDDCDPLGVFSAGEKLLFKARHKSDRSSLFTMNLLENSAPTLLWSHEFVDLESVVCSKLDGKPLVAFFEFEYPEYYSFDREIDEALVRFSELSGFSHFRRMDVDLAGKRFVIECVSDKNIGKTFYFDSTSDEWELLDDRSPLIEESELASVTPVEFRSIDDLLVRGYLTLPNGRINGRLPLVAIPHGGPWTRDYWEYNPMVQFFANRGFAVLQMNFRGSSGYGEVFKRAGDKEWGFGMQDDISYGVKWAVEQRIADPDKIIICGGSYGGFAALSGMVFTPDLYRAGIMINGVYDLEEMILSLEGRGRDYWNERVGDPSTEKGLIA
ncbi:MAG: prolyl oligopeptidase family serine peptidase, partial [Verrucomicrobiota bacterium]